MNKYTEGHYIRPGYEEICELVCAKMQQYWHLDIVELTFDGQPMNYLAALDAAKKLISDGQDFDVVLHPPTIVSEAVYGTEGEWIQNPYGIGEGSFCPEVISPEIRTPAWIEIVTKRKGARVTS